jgi:LysM domain
MSDRPSGGSDTGVGVLEQPAEPRPPDARPADARSAADLCPFLASADLDWRSVAATREHRCTAVEPVAALSVEKQRRLCLTADHATCTTYLAARQHLLDGTDEPGDGPGHPETDGDQREVERPILRWAVPRTAPVVLDRGRPAIRDVLIRRSTTQSALVLLMALAFVVLVMARLSADGAGARPSPSSAAPASGAPAASAPAAVASPLASQAPAASASAVPGASASVAVPSPSPSAARTYRVVAGDTLTSIAARFGVTLRALEAANGITNPSLLRVGTVLKIP